MLCLNRQSIAFVGTIVAALTLAFVAPAKSAPLGLATGDEISFLEWDSLRTI